MATTIHDLTIRKLLAKDASLKRIGMWHAIKKHLYQHGYTDALGLDVPRFHSDAWKLEKRSDSEWWELICIEVEDRHPIDAEKLGQYFDLWFDLDCTDVLVTVRLFVCDRHGNNMHEINVRDDGFQVRFPNCSDENRRVIYYRGGWR